MNQQDKLNMLAKYWEGNENKLVRWSVYLRSGSGYVNSFRDEFLGILALYFVLKLHVWWLIPIVLLISIPPLIMVGRWVIQRVGPTTEYVNAIKGSVMGDKGYEATYATIEALEVNKQQNEKLDQIIKLLENANHPSA